MLSLVRKKYFIFVYNELKEGFSLHRRFLLHKSPIKLKNMYVNGYKLVMRDIFNRKLKKVFPKPIAVASNEKDKVFGEIYQVPKQMYDEYIKSANSVYLKVKEISFASKLYDIDSTCLFIYSEFGFGNDKEIKDGKFGGNKNE